VDALVAPAATGREARPPKAVLVASSDFPELLGMCDRIAVMCRGGLGPARPAAEWDEHALLMAATGATGGDVA
jgi:ribose transport system ATP-binding protein